MTISPDIGPDQTRPDGRVYYKYYIKSYLILMLVYCFSLPHIDRLCNQQQADDHAKSQLFVYG